MSVHVTVYAWPKLISLVVHNAPHYTLAHSTSTSTITLSTATTLFVPHITIASSPAGLVSARPVFMLVFQTACACVEVEVLSYSK